MPCSSSRSDSLFRRYLHLWSTMGGAQRIFSFCGCAPRFSRWFARSFLWLMPALTTASTARCRHWCWSCPWCNASSKSGSRRMSCRFLAARASWGAWRRSSTWRTRLDDTGPSRAAAPAASNFGPLRWSCRVCLRVWSYRCRRSRSDVAGCWWKGVGGLVCERSARWWLVASFDRLWCIAGTIAHDILGNFTGGVMCVTPWVQLVIAP